MTLSSPCMFNECEFYSLATTGTSSSSSSTRVATGREHSPMIEATNSSRKRSFDQALPTASAQAAIGTDDLKVQLFYALYSDAKKSPISYMVNMDDCCLKYAGHICTDRMPVVVIKVLQMWMHERSLVEKEALTFFVLDFLLFRCCVDNKQACKIAARAWGSAATDSDPEVERWHGMYAERSARLFSKPIVLHKPTLKMLCEYGNAISAAVDDPLVDKNCFEFILRMVKPPGISFPEVHDDDGKFIDRRFDESTLQFRDDDYDELHREVRTWAFIMFVQDFIFKDEGGYEDLFAEAFNKKFIDYAITPKTLRSEMNYWVSRFGLSFPYVSVLRCWEHSSSQLVNGT